jgi:hypothetical protein
LDDAVVDANRVQLRRGLLSEFPPVRNKDDVLAPRYGAVDEVGGDDRFPGPGRRYQADPPAAGDDLGFNARDRSGLIIAKIRHDSALRLGPAGNALDLFEELGLFGDRYRR